MRSTVITAALTATFASYTVSAGGPTVVMPVGQIELVVLSDDPDDDGAVGVTGLLTPLANWSM